MIKAIVLTCFLAFGSFITFAQSPDDKSQMEREREEIQRQLSDLQSIYARIKGEKNVTLGQANMIKRKMELQERYLNNINRELRIINDDIYLSTLEINKLRKQLDTLKTQYSRSVVYAYKTRSTYDYLNFIFSATSFNDALKRVAYLKSYRSYREQQVNNILGTQKEIQQRMLDQVNKKAKKNTVLQEQTKQVRELESQKREKDVVVAKLKTQEKDVQKEINSKKKRDRDLKNAMAAIVRREIEEARKEAARKSEVESKNKPKVNPTTNPAGSITAPTVTKTTSRPKSYLDLNESDITLNKEFERNRGKLPWPVDKGVVSIHFGKYSVEGTSLTGDNPGITIATPTAGVSVKSVFDGEVAGVYNMGDGMAITIRHGKYFTTYSNLASVSVSKGATVSTGQSIGRAALSENGSGGQVDFILMIETKNVNPEPWFRSR